MAADQDIEAADDFLVRAGMAALAELLAEQIEGKDDAALELWLVEEPLILLDGDLA
jgi:hypothetical protein